MEHFIGAFKKFADFSGRARRKEYWMFILFYFITCIALFILMAVAPLIGMIAFFAFLIAVIIPTISITTRRLHDIGRSGWWQLLHITGIGSLVIFIFTLLDSQPDNEFGPNPKA